MIYTDSEMSEKKYTVKQAVDAAKFIVFDRTKQKASFSINRDLNEKITLRELNDITDSLLDNYHNWTH